MVLRKSFYIRWSAGRSPRVHEVNPGRDPSKYEAIDAFKQYKIEVENQLNKKIKMIRSDRGGEYEFPFQEICLENGIIHQMTLEGK